MDCSSCQKPLDWNDAHQRVLCSLCMTKEGTTHCGRCKAVVKTSKLYTPIVGFFRGIHIRPNFYLTVAAKLMLGLLIMIAAISLVVGSLYSFGRLGYFICTLFTSKPPPDVVSVGFSGLLCVFDFVAIIGFGCWTYTIGQDVYEWIERKFR